MSGLAKFFIVVMLILSLILAVASTALFAQRTNWFDKFQEEKGKVTAAEEKAKQAVADKDQSIAAIQKKLDDAVAENKIIEGQRDEFKAEWQRQKTEYNKLNDKLERLVTITQEQSDNITDLSEANTRIEAENGRVKDERDQATAERIEAIKGAVQLEKITEKQLAQIEDSERLIAELNKEIIRISGRGDTEQGTVIGPRVQGIVSYVKEPFIGISVGLDDDVKVGAEFAVHKGTTFVTRIKVVRVDRDVSVAKELKQWRYDAARQIEEGDTISNAI